MTYQFFACQFVTIISPEDMLDSLAIEASSHKIPCYHPLENHPVFRAMAHLHVVQSDLSKHVRELPSCLHAINQMCEGHITSRDLDNPLSEHQAANKSKHTKNCSMDSTTVLHSITP